MVGTSKEHIEANWVRNEWSRFLDRIKNEPQTLNGNNFIPIFKDMNPYDMPKVNNSFVQGVDANKLGYALTVVDGVQKILKPEKDKKVLDVLDNIENIEQFEKIRKQRNLELKQKRWKEFNENPNNKVKKFFYKLFLYSPYILSLISLIMVCDKHTWFFKNYQFYILLFFVITNITLTILTICKHKKYALKTFINIVFPFLLILLTIVSFIICHTLIPITYNGSTASNYYYAKYYKGFIYYPSNNQGYIDINCNSSLNSYVKYINNKKHLILPDEIEGKKILTINLLLDKDIEVIVLPKFANNCDIQIINKDFSLKEIYTNSEVTWCSIYNYWEEWDKSAITLYYLNQIPTDSDQLFDNIQQKAFNY